MNGPVRSYVVRSKPTMADELLQYWLRTDIIVCKSFRFMPSSIKRKDSFTCPKYSVMTFQLNSLSLLSSSSRSCVNARKSRKSLVDIGSEACSNCWTTVRMEVLTAIFLTVRTLTTDHIGLCPCLVQAFCHVHVQTVR